MKLKSRDESKVKMGSPYYQWVNSGMAWAPYCVNNWGNGWIVDSSHCQG